MSFKILTDLIKLRITIASTITTALGYTMARGGIDTNIIPVLIGGLLLASAAGSTAYCTWMMKGYFETIPIEIEEAATIDGLNRFGNFTKIAFPLAKSGLVAVLIFTFLTSWQDFILARTFLRTVSNYTLPLLADNYENSATFDAQPFFELLAPYSILVALPVVVFFMVMQKQLASGAVAGSVK